MHGRAPSRARALPDDASPIAGPSGRVKLFPPHRAERGERIASLDSNTMKGECSGEQCPEEGYGGKEGKKQKAKGRVSFYCGVYVPRGRIGLGGGWVSRCHADVQVEVVGPAGFAVV